MYFSTLAIGAVVASTIQIAAAQVKRLQSIPKEPKHKMRRVRKTHNHKKNTAVENKNKPEFGRVEAQFVKEDNVLPASAKSEFLKTDYGPDFSYGYHGTDNYYYDDIVDHGGDYGHHGHPGTDNYYYDDDYYYYDDIADHGGDYGHHGMDNYYYDDNGYGHHGHHGMDNYYYDDYRNHGGDYGHHGHHGMGNYYYDDYDYGSEFSYDYHGMDNYYYDDIVDHGGEVEPEEYDPEEYDPQEYDPEDHGGEVEPEDEEEAQMMDAIFQECPAAANAMAQCFGAPVDLMMCMNCAWETLIERGPLTCDSLENAQDSYELCPEECKSDCEHAYYGVMSCAQDMLCVPGEGRPGGGPAGGGPAGGGHHPHHGGEVEPEDEEEAQMLASILQECPAAVNSMVHCFGDPDDLMMCMNCAWEKVTESGAPTCDALENAQESYYEVCPDECNSDCKDAFHGVMICAQDLFCTPPEEGPPEEGPAGGGPAGGGRAGGGPPVPEVKVVKSKVYLKAE